MAHEVYESGITNGHQHLYNPRSTITGPGPDGHTHRIVTLGSHVVFMEHTDGHSHDPDPRDIAQTSEFKVPFEEDDPTTA